MHHTTPTTRRRGYAMIVVMSLVAVAAVVTWSVLAEASLTAETAVARTHVDQSDMFAESGVQLGLHYLADPAAAEADGFTVMAAADGLYAPAVTIAPKPNIVVEVDTESKGNTLWEVRSTATIVSGGTAVRRDHAALARRPSGFTPTHALHGLGDIRLNPNWDLDNGGVRSTGRVYFLGLPRSYPVAARNHNLHEQGQPVPAEADAFTVPDKANQHFLGLVSQYVFNGSDGWMRTHNDQEIGAADVPAAASDNPANVNLYNDHELVANNVGTYPGTLATRGDLYVTGRLDIRPAGNMPALLVGGELVMAPGSELIVNGLVFVHDGITTKTDGVFFVPGQEFAEWNIRWSGGDLMVEVGDDELDLTEWDGTENNGTLLPAPTITIDGSLLMERKAVDLAAGYAGDLTVRRTGQTVAYLSTAADVDVSGNRAGEVEVLGWR